MVFQLITKMLTGEASIYIARLRTIAVIYAIMAVFALALLFFLLLALFVWIAQSFGVLATAIGFAVGCLVILIGVYVFLLIARRPPRQRAADRMQRDVASIASIAAVSNMPLLFRSVRRRKSLLLVPVALASAWGLFRVVQTVRDGNDRG
ncbi:hypothetical protein D3218_07550 [Aureimonas flava]|uniref:Phage holin family protein n=1 Tax=Aureimonas flava TaxID=2320271 RepID=A0A3A1WLF5_9HYPH|nr:hypothetical protein [Aureimonas flava]RIY02139.1 hypothetical protein D3218_07550 [Aureimonas flava]